MVKEFFEWVKEGAKEFGENISVLVNSILLSIVYFLGVGSSSIVAKIKGKKFLDMDPDKSYWKELNLGKLKEEEYYRQF